VERATEYHRSKDGVRVYKQKDKWGKRCIITGSRRTASALRKGKKKKKTIEELRNKNKKPQRLLALLCLSKGQSYKCCVTKTEGQLQEASWSEFTPRSWGHAGEHFSVLSRQRGTSFARNPRGDKQPAPSSCCLPRLSNPTAPALTAELFLPVKERHCQELQA